MKRLAAVLTLLIMVPTAAGAYYFTDYSAEVRLDDPVEHRIRGEVFTEEGTREIALTVTGEPDVESAQINDVSVETRVERSGDSYSLILQPREELAVNTTQSFDASFTTPPQLEKTDKGMMYTNALTPDRRIDNYKLTVTLPEEAFIAFENDAPLISPTADLSTDGQEITLQWETSLDEGEAFTALVVYREESGSALPLIGGGAILALLIAALTIRRRFDSLQSGLQPIGGTADSDEGNREETTSGETPGKDEGTSGEESATEEETVPLDSIQETLKDSEKEILNVIISYDGKAMQKDVVRELDFSKSKVSKVLRGLEVKGIIEKKPYGRTNRLVIADKYEW